MFCQLLFLVVAKDSSTFQDIWIYLLGFDYGTTIELSEFYKIQNFDKDVDFELGWAFYTKLLTLISSNNSVLLFFSGLIIIHSYFNVIKKHSQIVWFSIFLFITIVFYNSLFVLRQNLATAILLYSFPYIIDRKFIKFLFVLLIAFLFHKTALIFLVLYFVYPIKLNRKNILLIIISSLVFSFLFIKVIEIVTTILTGFEVYSGGIGDSSIGNLTPLLISLTTLIFVILNFYPISKINGYEKLFFFMIFFMIIIDFSRIGLTGTMGRLNMYFAPALLILIPNACLKIKTPLLKYLSILLLGLLYLILMFNQMNYGFELL
jgi:transmembrane protein EpsG